MIAGTRRRTKIALDPYVHRHTSLVELPALVAELGYEYIELSPRADFLDWWEEKAMESSRFMRKEIQPYVDKYWGAVNAR